MNKPAPKEPSMDEILSSIRQIIADDDASSAPPSRPVQVQGGAADQSFNVSDASGDAGRATRSGLESEEDEEEPLTLSLAQILADEEADAEPEVDRPDFSALVSEAEDKGEIEVPGGATQSAADFVDPEDITFEESGTDADKSAPVDFAAMSEASPDSLVEPEATKPEPDMSDMPVSERAVPLDPAPEFVAKPTSEPDATARLRANSSPKPVFSVPPRNDPSAFSSRSDVSVAAPMPDAGLSADITEQLLEPATNAAVRHTFAKLNNLGLGTQGMTIESMLREMLRPMLKEWLDENLPSVVERMVEKEISRISRDVD